MFTVYFDLETGGIESTRPTIQLAAIAVNDHGQEVSAFEQNIAFNEADCDPEALAMNHYTAEAWKDAQSPAVVASLFAAWLRPYQSLTLTSKRTGNPYTVARLAGYNALTFDLPRLKAMFGTQFCPWDPRVRDVLQRVLFYFDDARIQPENYKLSTIAEFFGVNSDGAHGALADCRMCAAVRRSVTEAW